MLELSLFSLLHSTYADLSGTDSRMVKSTSVGQVVLGQPGYKYASRSFVKLIGETFEFTCPNVLISFYCGLDRRKGSLRAVRISTLLSNATLSHDKFIESN